MHPISTSRTRSWMGLAVVVLLAGCTVGVNSGAGDRPAPSPSSRPGQQSPSLVALGWPSDRPEGVDIPTKDALSSLVSREVNCASGTEEIDDIEVAVEITADCGRVIVTGTDAIVLAQQVDTLEIDAIGAYAYVESAKSVILSGIDVHVRWHTGSPSVTDDGLDNTARRTGP